MNREKFLEAIIEEIEGFNDKEMMQLNNEYCMNASIQDAMIFDNDRDFFDNYFSDAFEAVRSAHYGNYSYSDSFVTFNGYGNLESLNSIGTSDLADSLDAVAEAVADNFNKYGFLFTVDPDDYEEEEEEDKP